MTNIKYIIRYKKIGYIIFKTYKSYKILKLYKIM